MPRSGCFARHVPGSGAAGLVPAILLLALSPAQAFATSEARSAAPPPAPTSDPASPRADLGYFVGAWNIQAVDPRTGEREAFTYRVTSTLGGSWLAGEGVSLKGDFASRDMWSQDPAGAMSRFVFSQGGSYTILRSPGWKGERLVFDSDVASVAQAPRLRQTITRIGRNEFRAVWEVFRDGAWQTYSDERVTRS